jgi:hypothetical protein
MTKFLTVASVLLLLVAAFFLYHTVNQAVTIDHLQMSVTGFAQREKCLLRTAQSFAETHNEETFRKWARTELSDLDYHDEERQLIINGVGFAFKEGMITVE